MNAASEPSVAVRLSSLAGVYRGPGDEDSDQWAGSVPDLLGPAIAPSSAAHRAGESWHLHATSQAAA